MKDLIVTGCIALGTFGVFAGPLCDVRAGPAGAGPDRALIVTSVTPERNRQVLPDLSDPGVNSVLTVRFSTYLNAHDVLDEKNLVNGLSAKCGFHDQTLATVPASAAVRLNVLTIDPFSAKRPTLPQARYTLTLKSSIRSMRGGRLNDGAAGFTTTFSVGSGTFAPVLLKISPKAGKTGVGLRRAVVATFDEPIDAASASTSVRLEDRSTVPPTPILSLVRLSRHGLDVIVTPAARSGYPTRTDVTLVIAGRGSSPAGSSTILTETGGHEFKRDAGPQWTADLAVPTLFHSPSGDFDDVSGEFTMTFRTKGAVRR